MYLQFKTFTTLITKFQFLTLCLRFIFPSTLSIFNDFLLDFFAAMDEGYGGSNCAGGGFDVVSGDAKNLRRIGDFGGKGGT